MSSKPLISVIMSVFNGGPYLSLAIDSILHQTYKNFEFLIIDDASSDETVSILNRYANLDSRIRTFFNTDRKGLTKNLNTLIQKAEGLYIARMDADDISLPHRFEEQRFVLDNNKEVQVCFTGTFLIDKDGKDVCASWRPKKIRDILSVMDLHNNIPHPTVVMRKEALLKVGCYNENFLTGQDTDLWKRFLREEYNFYYLNKILLKYRLNPTSVRQYLKRSYQFELASCCIANKCKAASFRYFNFLTKSEIFAIIIRLIIPFCFRYYKGVPLFRYLQFSFFDQRL